MANFRVDEVTNDQYCPYCHEEGRDKQNACKRHHWAYRAWLDGLEAGIEE